MNAQNMPLLLARKRRVFVSLLLNLIGTLNLVARVTVFLNKGVLQPRAMAFFIQVASRVFSALVGVKITQLFSLLYIKVMRNDT